MVTQVLPGFGPGKMKAEIGFQRPGKSVRQGQDGGGMGYDEPVMGMQAHVDGCFAGVGLAGVAGAGSSQEQSQQAQCSCAGSGPEQAGIEKASGHADAANATGNLTALFTRAFQARIKLLRQDADDLQPVV